jgi:hypothetical protein
MALGGAQDASVLSGRVQADEMMHPVPAADRESPPQRRGGGRHLVSEAYDLRLVKGLPDREGPFARVNRLCFLLRLSLNCRMGFDRASLPGWLGLFSVMMNPPDSKMEKAEMVLDWAMAFPNTLRHRDFYRGRPSSEGRALPKPPTLCKRGLCWH